jgi:enamine deaminase RidA (YjgF/YER057c/UK114 family)
MLALDDPRWPDLNHRGWSAGGASYGDPDSPVVADELRYLLANPADRQRFTALWPYLCSEGTAWPAAYAAVPYLVQIARQLSPAERFEHVYVVGLVVMCSGTYGRTPGGLPADIAAAYRHALPQALTLLTETLTAPHDLDATRYLLAAAAALKGHPALGDALNDLGLLARCQNCGHLTPR